MPRQYFVKLSSTCRLCLACSQKALFSIMRYGAEHYKPVPTQSYNDVTLPKKRTNAMQQSWLTRLLVITCLAFSISACSTQPDRPPSDSSSNIDPLEPINRKVFAFNDFLDRNILKPTAEAYVEYVPKIIRTGVNNFFTNLFSVFTIVNQVLQLKLVEAANDSARLVINTTVGLLGFIDVATMIGLEQHKEDFGQTLGYWGVGEGAYIVLPFFGPSTLRDSTSLVVDYQYYDPYDPHNHHELFPGDSDWAARGVNIVDIRAGLLALDGSLVEGDRYALIRDAFLQRRKFEIADGEVEEDPFADDDFEDDWESEEDYLELDFDTLDLP